MPHAAQDTAVDFPDLSQLGNQLEDKWARDAIPTPP